MEPIGTASNEPERAPVVTMGPTANTTQRTSFDPNDKHGPAGFGNQGFIQLGSMPYEIEFENVPNLGATIPAQEVFVTDTLDADLDLTTVEFTGFGFNNFKYTVPPGLFNYEITIDLRPDGINLLVPVKLEVNAQTRVLKATFRSLDPMTGLPPDEFDAGYLPVNNKTLHNGEGFFTYTVRPLADRVTGAVITNQASIVFDVNAPILTPTTRNTLDIGTPTSSVLALPSQSGPSLAVNWSGVDDAGGSGIASYSVFVSDNNGPFIVFVTRTTATSAVYTGTVGHTYRFYSVSTDNVGHVEAAPATFDAQTVVVAAPWQNNRLPNDVDNDSSVSPLDVLLIVNELNAPQYRCASIIVNPRKRDTKMRLLKMMIMFSGLSHNKCMKNTITKPALTVAIANESQTSTFPRSKED